jgi:predicted DCC family thiol-disulfide oxidoreductase YuxK
LRLPSISGTAIGRRPADGRKTDGSTADRADPQLMRRHPIILFDGVCALCVGSVQFVIRRDSDARCRFASLQSAAGQRLARQHGADPDALDSVLLIENGQLYRQSTAALRIARHLRWPWPLLQALRVIPPMLRDPVYRLIGRYRYRLFGRRSRCWVPDDALRDRFL